jgi:hypothetical protein
MALPNTSLTAGQSETVTAIPEDANGNPGSIAAGSIPTWTSSSSTVASVTPASDGLSAVVAALSAGTTTVTVAGESSFADSSISGQFTVTVTEAAATQIGFTFGSPS